MIGIVGGSGLYEIPGFSVLDRIKLNTPYGEPSDEFIMGSIGERKVVFLSRHGQHHHIPPHRVNYRANVWGFRTLGVKRIIAVNAVGGINDKYRPGDIVLPDQIIDFTKTRMQTFYNGPQVVHIDFTEPYCKEMREVFLSVDEQIINGGTYICTEGPRLETAGEIRFYKSIGADMVGMTQMPEAALAREATLCYLCIAVITNYAAGISRTKLTTTEVVETMKKSTEKVKQLLSSAIELIPSERHCICKDSLKDAEL